MCMWDTAKASQIRWVLQLIIMYWVCYGGSVINTWLKSSIITTSPKCAIYAMNRIHVWNMDMLCSALFRVYWMILYGVSTILLLLHWQWGQRSNTEVHVSNRPTANHTKTKASGKYVYSYWAVQYQNIVTITLGLRSIENNAGEFSDGPFERYDRTKWYLRYL